MINIIIPMAGRGSRFLKGGYKDPKPLIPIHGIPMIQLVIENLKPKKEHRFIFICQEEHIKRYNLENNLNKWTKNPYIIQVKGITEGAACSVLKAKEIINTNDILLIANSDQYINAKIDQYFNDLINRNIDGLIMTMIASGTQWSYVKTDKNNYVTQVAEKNPISSNATVGIYAFKRGFDFVYAAEKMIKAQEKVNEEYYVAPVYNWLPKDFHVGIYPVGSLKKEVFGLGTPEDLQSFLKNPLSFHLPGVKA